MTDSSSPEVVTGSGTFRGRDDGRVAVWKGLRFAEPPVGERRWRAPVAASPGAGVVEAVAFGPAAPQPLNPVIFLGDGIARDEDCLFLNVWAPSGAVGLPVMVWVHGGAYALGSASQPLYDGAALATSGDVVVVTLNYRLGALGFLDLTSFGDSFDSNLALRDVLLGLEWVRDNIAGFGGDPSAVTLFGESAGGGMVCALLAAPAAAGLFARAIVQSSPATSIYGTTRSRAVAQRFLTAVRASVDEVRELPVDAIVAASTLVYDAVPSEEPGTLAFAPTVDGAVLPEHPITVLREGRGHPVPLVIGTNRDEATLFKFMKSPLIPITEEKITAMLRQLAEESPGTVLPTREQLSGAYEGVRQRMLGLGVARDIGFRMPTVWLTEGHSAIAPTWLYRFDHATPMLRLIGIGAAHATELPYTWGNFGASKKDFTFRLGGRRAALEISRRLMGRWTAFAHGDPPGDDWPAYGDDRATLVIERHDRVEPDLDGALRKGWGDQVLSFS
ncbi:carboxylesterase/lipase family protein [Nakamurella deserti]|uniref:carboxylesterase/lipase family protein n=1 Tax=Nakamurella deserti TaxID=2164074 RepID=UPI000DBE2A14|nr:carboxylesterase/lipase family protein [Nakamurella deserti]